MPFAVTTNPVLTHDAVLLTGLVLAGGRSSRMGQDKARLSLNGELLLHRSHRLLQESGCSEVYLSGQPRPEWPTDEHFVIPDQIPDAGPVAALCSAITALQQRAGVLLVCAVDTPLLTPALLGALTQPLHQQPAYDAICYQKHPIPLALRLSEAVNQHAKKALKALQQGQSVAIYQFLGKINTLRLPTSTDLEHQLSNINTPAEWNWLHSHTGVPLP